MWTGVTSVTSFEANNLRVTVMFGIDPYVFETLWPSLMGVAGMSAAMIWGFMKVRKLIKEDPKK